MANTTWHKQLNNKSINAIGINNKLKSYISLLKHTHGQSDLNMLKL